MIYCLWPALDYRKSNQWIPFFTVVCLFFGVFSELGCYSYGRGERLGFRELPETQRTDTTLDIQLWKKPTVEAPWVSWDISEVRSRSVRRIPRYDEVATVDMVRNVVALVLGPPPFFGKIWWDLVLPRWNRDWTTPSEAKREQWNYRAVNDNLYKFWKSKGGWSYSEATGDTLEGEAEEFDDTPQIVPLWDTDVVVSCEGRPVTLKTDQNGLLTCDVVKDLGLRAVFSTDPIELKLLVTRRSFSKSFFLNPNDWTIPHVRIIVDSIAVTDSDGNVVIIRGTLTRGNEVQVRFEHEDLLRIRGKGIEGFVPKKSGVTFWAIPGHESAP